MPIFEVEGNYDEEDIKKLQDIVKINKIETINYNTAGLKGGLLSCITWTIQE